MSVAEILPVTQQMTIAEKRSLVDELLREIEREECLLAKMQAITAPEVWSPELSSEGMEIARRILSEGRK